MNGIPVATCEIKTDDIQAVEDAVLQYRKDRPPRVAGSNAVKPLLAFPQGALVHFALSNSAVRMTTKLDGFATVFLPFDQGDAGATGNPPNSAGYAPTIFRRKCGRATRGSRASTATSCRARTTPGSS